MPNDRLEIWQSYSPDLTYNAATGEVSWQGVVFGQVSGGVGDDFVVAFNGDADLIAIRVMIGSLLYSVDGAPTLGDHVLTYTLYDAAGNASLGDNRFTPVDPAGDGLPDFDSSVAVAAGFADLDGDGDFDFALGMLGSNDIRYFLNTGTAQVPIFEEQTDAANPFDTIDGHGYAHATFFDIDGDSDLDLIVADANGQIELYRNDGTAQSGVFVAVAGDPFEGIDAAYGSAAIALGDMDYDGLPDLLVGDVLGGLTYFKNTGSAGAPAFTAQFGIDNPFVLVSGFGFRSTPTLVDIDGDGDLDLDLGTSSNGHRLFVNDGIGYSKFSDGVQNPIIAAAPALQPHSSYVDIDGDGDIDLITSGAGGLGLLLNGPLVGSRVTVSIVATPPAITGLPASVNTYELDLTSGPVLLGLDVEVEGGDNGLHGATLVVTGLLPEDSVTILSEGNDPGQVFYDSATGEIFYGGNLRGLVSGGANGADLVIQFNNAAGPGSVEAIIERLAYANLSNDPTGSRILAIQLTDAQGVSGGAPGQLTERSTQFGGLDLVGELDASAAFGDLDHDGDLDLIVANRQNELSYYINYGSATAPAYARLTAPLYGSVGVAGDDMRVALGDLDGDGDLDLLTGDDQGDLQVYENVGGPAGPAWQLKAQDLFGGIGAGNSVGGMSFADIDGDGDLDLAVGTSGGFIRYFENAGTAQAAQFVHVFGAGTPLDGVGTTTSASPTFGDFDGDGDFDLFLGDYATGAYFENTGTATAPHFIAADNPVELITTGGLRRPVAVDIDGDGDLDLISGHDESFGGLIGFSQQGAEFEFELRIGEQNGRPTLTGLATSRTFAENLVNAAPRLLIQGAVFNDDGPYHGGHLTLGGLLAEDRVSVRNQGSGAGQVGFDAATGLITWGGVLIGVLAGGDGQLATVSLTPGATKAAIQALIDNLTYADVSESPTGSRTLSLSFADGDGATLPPNGPLQLTALTGSNNPLNGVNYGGNSAPTVIDLDGNLFADLIIRSGANLRAMLGTSTLFEEVSSGQGPFDGFSITSNAAFLTFDADGDGDLDLLYRNGSGVLHAYENQGFGNLVANTTLGSMAPYEGINIGNGARHMVRADVSAGLTGEIVIGNNNGTISVLAFNGTTYALVAAGQNPFNGISAGTNAAPAFFDTDGDGDLDMLLGLGDGTIRYYRNNAGAFAQQTGANNPLNGVDVGNNATPAFIDRDRDGVLDWVISGTSTGTLRTWANTSSTAIAITVGVTAQGEIYNDGFSLLENGTVSGSVASNNGFGADDPGQTVTAINGQVFTPGVAIVLPSGARLTMAVGGTFTYDPNHRFDGLGSPTSGATNTSAIDSFTYTASDETATVTFVITGVDSSNDVLVGNNNINEITGGDGNDIINGLGGNDQLFGGTGGDILNGDDGADQLFGGDGADKLNGGAGGDALNGGVGNDRMDGGDGTDSLTGGADNDYLDGGLGGDLMTGGLGNDVFIVDDAGDQTVEAADEGYDIVRTDLTWTLAANIEGLELQGTGNAGATGNTGANNLQGNSGDNLLQGLGGVDTINGVDGDDVIVGGEGNDLLRGGLGADTFRVAHAFGPVLETDQVYDFSAAEGDIVDLSQIDAIPGGADNAFTLVSAFNKHAGQMTLTFAASITTLKLDVNGDGKADYQMKINGDVTGDIGDWLL